eukprot:scaffold33924_cov60-Phaeocystis_antarctica.AAC.5
MARVDAQESRPRSLGLGVSSRHSSASPRAALVAATTAAAGTSAVAQSHLHVAAGTVSVSRYPVRVLGPWDLDVLIVLNLVAQLALETLCKAGAAGGELSVSHLLSKSSRTLARRVRVAGTSCSLARSNFSLFSRLSLARASFTSIGILRNCASPHEPRPIIARNGSAVRPNCVLDLGGIWRSLGSPSVGTWTRVRRPLETCAVPRERITS